MTKEQLKNILIENKCIATDEWSDENPFVGIDLDALHDILAQEKQQWIEKACKYISCYRCEYIDFDDFKKAMED